MKIVVLSTNPRLYSTRRLRETAEARGHDVRVVDPLRCYMDITSRHPRVIYRGDDLQFDAVIPDHCEVSAVGHVNPAQIGLAVDAVGEQPRRQDPDDHPAR